MARRKQKEEEKRRKIATEQDEQQRELALETSMQRDIDGLFATVLVNTPSTTSDAQDWDSSENSVPNQPHASDTGRLDVPESQGPSISPNHRQLNSLSEPGPSLLGARRPKASDFEGEPTAPSAALAVPGRASFLPDSAPGINLVIEFDEEDHDIASAYHKGDSFESAAQSTQLEKRELELKRLREKVALMEKKRKNRAASQSRASTPTQGDVHTPISASVPSPSKSFEVSSASTSAQNALVPVSSTALGYAQDEIQRLQQERMALMADHLAVENISETQGNIFPDADARSSYETAPASPEPVDMVIDTSPIDDTFDAINQGLLLVAA